MLAAVQQTGRQPPARSPIMPHYLQTCTAKEIDHLPAADLQAAGE
jgi:hypothetical protein